MESNEQKRTRDMDTQYRLTEVQGEVGGVDRMKEGERRKEHLCRAYGHGQRGEGQGKGGQGLRGEDKGAGEMRDTYKNVNNENKT